MKTFLSTLAGCMVASSLIFISSCSEPEEPGIKKKPEVRPSVMDMDIVASIYPATTTAMPVRDSLRIFFNAGDLVETTIDGKPHRAVIDLITLESTITKVWAEDKLSVTLYPADMLNANASFTLTVKAHWERKVLENWKPVMFEGQEASETVTHQFSTGQAAITIPADNIKSLYPIPNQYHFLMDENPTSFIQLKRAQNSMFESATHTYAAIFTPSAGPTVEAVVSYNKPTKTISFNTPDLLTETIYKLTVVAREGANTKKLIEYHFRTSKYKTFTEKFNSVIYTGSTFSVLAAPWRGHYLYQFISTSGEYFDSFESEVKFETVTGIDEPGNTHLVPVASNLVRFEAVLTGTPWYNQLYPMLYAPWTDADFKPTVTRDTTLAGYPPKRAMYVDSFGEGVLTPALIAAGSAPPLAKGTSPSIRFCLPLIVLQDFREIQAQAVNRYVNLPNVAAREQAIIWNLMPPLGSAAGTYPYKIKYTLPSGKVTTTLSKSMTFGS